MLTGLTRAQRARVALVAPQAANCSWYPESAFVDLEQNQPDLDAAVERLATILDDLRNRGVSPQRIVVFGFSQGACLALETVLRVSGRVQSAPCAAVVAYAGALIGPGVEPATDYSVCHNKAGPMEAGSGTAPEGQLPLTGIRFELGVADKDPHVPIARTRATAALLRRFGALDVGERYFSGEGIEHHRITEDQQAAAVATFQAVFQGVVAADLSSTSSGVLLSCSSCVGVSTCETNSKFTLTEVDGLLDCLRRRPRVASAVAGIWRHGSLVIFPGRASILGRILDSIAIDRTSGSSSNWFQPASSFSIRSLQRMHQWYLFRGSTCGQLSMLVLSPPAICCFANSTSPTALVRGSSVCGRLQPHRWTL